MKQKEEGTHTTTLKGLMNNELETDLKTILVVYTKQQQTEVNIQIYNRGDQSSDLSTLIRAQVYYSTETRYIDIKEDIYTYHIL